MAIRIVREGEKRDPNLARPVPKPSQVEAFRKAEAAEARKAEPPTKKPIVEKLKKEIEKIEKSKAPKKKPAAGRRPSADKQGILSVPLPQTLIDKIHQKKNWQKILLTIISHEFGE